MLKREWKRPLTNIITEELQNKINNTIEALKLAEKMSDRYYDGNPVVITYSGGKDSDVLLQLAIESGINFEAIHCHTSADAPDTVYHIRRKFTALKNAGNKCSVLYANDSDGNPITLWNLIEKKGMPPTRIVRQCCKYLKERTIPYRVVCTGVRAEESAKRKQRSQVEIIMSQRTDSIGYTLDGAINAIEKQEKGCKLIRAAKQNKTICFNPVFDWTADDIWVFINNRKIEYNPLYDKGFNRVGCIGCPLGNKKEQLREFEMFPKYKQMYMRAFDRMLKKSRESGKETTWETSEDVFRWWLRIEDDENVAN